MHKLHARLQASCVGASAGRALKRLKRVRRRHGPEPGHPQPDYRSTPRSRRHDLRRLERASGWPACRRSARPRQDQEGNSSSARSYGSGRDRIAAPFYVHCTSTGVSSRSLRHGSSTCRARCAPRRDTTGHQTQEASRRQQLRDVRHGKPECRLAPPQAASA